MLRTFDKGYGIFVGLRIPCADGNWSCARRHPGKAARGNQKQKPYSVCPCGNWTYHDKLAKAGFLCRCGLSVGTPTDAVPPPLGEDSTEDRPSDTLGRLMEALASIQWGAFGEQGAQMAAMVQQAMEERKAAADAKLKALPEKPKPAVRDLAQQAKEAGAIRIRLLYDRTTKVAKITRAEQQLAELQAEVEALDGRIKEADSAVQRAERDYRSERRQAGCAVGGDSAQESDSDGMSMGGPTANDMEADDDFGTANEAEGGAALSSNQKDLLDQHKRLVKQMAAAGLATQTKSHHRKGSIKGPLSAKGKDCKIYLAKKGASIAGAKAHAAAGAAAGHAAGAALVLSPGDALDGRGDAQPLG